MGLFLQLIRSGCLWLLVLPLLLQHAAASSVDFDATLGFPGEGPLAGHILVDEASGGSWPLGSASLAAPPQAAPWQEWDAETGRRARKPRVRLRDKCWSLVTANVTAWFRADELLASATKWGHIPDVFLFQETAKCSEQVAEVRSSLAARRWQAEFAPSVRTPALGVSAGCAVVGRWSSTFRWLATPDVEKKHPGRFLAAIWSGVLVDGVLVASIYAYTGEGSEVANVELLELVARELASCRLPFVLGGDWNMSPAGLAATGMPARLRAAVVHPDEPTYMAAGCESTLDFFLVSEALRPAALSVEVIGGTEVRKHKPVRMC